MSSFCSAKATHIFSAKNIRILYIKSAKTVNEMTLNELIKLMTFEQLGPSRLLVLCVLNLLKMLSATCLRINFHFFSDTTEVLLFSKDL